MKPLILCLQIGHIDQMILVMRKLVSEFLTRSDTNQVVQPEEMNKCLNFFYLESEGILYMYLTICEKQSCG